MNKINKKNSYIAFNILILLLFIIVLIFPKKVLTTTNIELDNVTPMEPFHDGTVITQDFSGSKNHKKFAIHFATYQHIYEDGKINVTITNHKTNKKVKKVIKATSLTDTSATTINYPLKKNVSYTIEIKTKGIPEEHKLTLYTTDFDNDEHKLTINGEEQKGNLVFYYIDNQNSYFNIWYVFLLLSISVILYPICMMEGEKNEK